MEPVTGIEPVLLVYKTSALPLDDTGIAAAFPDDQHPESCGGLSPGRITVKRERVAGAHMRADTGN